MILLFESAYAMNTSSAYNPTDGSSSSSSSASSRPMASTILNQLGGLRLVRALLSSPLLVWQRCGAVLLGYCYGMDPAGHRLLVNSSHLVRHLSCVWHVVLLSCCQSTLPHPNPTLTLLSPNPNTFEITT